MPIAPTEVFAIFTMGSSTVSTAFGGASSPEVVTLAAPFVYVPLAPLTTSTVIVQELWPIARSPPVTLIVPEPAVAVRTNAAPAESTHVPPTFGTGATTTPAGNVSTNDQSGLADKAGPNIKIRRGALIRVAKTPKNTWEITQLPEVEGAFVALDPRDGSIRALVGGFDFAKNKFNHVTQAWRQPGSSFKPFIYSAALERGFTPATVINDAPLFFDAGVTGGQPWEPKNYDGTFDGPMSLRTGLKKSKNMVSIRSS